MTESPFPVDINRSTMGQNVEIYKAMHGELVERYLGQYVAICDGRLVDHDPDPVAILQRVRDRYPDRVILRHKVELAPERELHIRHPRIEESTCLESPRRDAEWSGGGDGGAD